MANQIVLFDTGRSWLLKQLVVGGNTTLDGNVTFRFFSNDVTLSPSGPSVPFIALSMPGYSPFVLSGAVDEGIDANGNDTYIWPVEKITNSDGSGATYISYGYWVTANADGTALWGQLFDVPAVWSNPGDYATVAPQFSLGTLLLSASPLLSPLVLSLSPSSGSTAGGTSVLIYGTYFTGATAVTFGGVDAASFTVVTDNTILATSPPGAAGTVDVQVVTGVGASKLWTYDEYTYS